MDGECFSVDIFLILIISTTTLSIMSVRFYILSYSFKFIYTLSFSLQKIIVGSNCRHSGPLTGMHGNSLAIYQCARN